MGYKLADIDIDVGNRSNVITALDMPYTFASQEVNANSISPHLVGLYFNDITKDLLSNYATLDYKQAAEIGFMKIDILPNHIYDNFKNRKEIEESVSKEPNWDLLYKEEIFSTLPQISGYSALLNDLPKIDSIEKLAMFIAIIRPSKKYLIPILKKAQDWNSILDEIWLKSDTDEYQFKKSHAIAYALSIIALINKKALK